MDVSPRTSPTDQSEASTTTSRRRPKSRAKTIGMSLILVMILGAIGFLLVKQVGEATLYFYNADKAVAQRQELGDRRFRIQGTYEGAKTDLASGGIQFAIVYNGAKVIIDHTGSEPALFKPGIPVVCEGRWSPDGKTFQSDRIEVKHSEVYKEKNPTRVDPAAP